MLASSARSKLTDLKRIKQILCFAKICNNMRIYLLSGQSGSYAKLNEFSAQN